ncbi:MAG: biopolymer transporter ExbD [Prevotellaceae bacterium]|nr:biopolymer transporter ExbD [Prevotella sp.]MDD7258366.1 biopolymer transporter ExbD [Prevotellaceae bacterium]MDY6129924.1 biopolymer transporter ExbD [Prevotella sp.]
MSMFRRRERKVPGLNMASMPDLIFTVLFFFMIVTHMRSVPLKVKYQMPAGTELTKLTNKSTTTYIYIGRPVNGKGQETGGEMQIQMNDKLVDVPSVTDYVASERKRMSPEDVEVMTVSLKADKNVDMGLITDVKQALRKAKAGKVNYSGVYR